MEEMVAHGVGGVVEEGSDLFFRALLHALLNLLEQLNIVSPTGF
jgi:hypothetical protein